MGAGASAERATLVERLPKTTDYHNLYLELAADDGIDMDGLKTGMKNLGFQIPDDQVGDIFRRFKTLIADNPKLVRGSLFRNLPASCAVPLGPKIKN
jgi:hypothetical protein